MKKLILMLLFAAFSLSTFAGVPPQQDTTKKTQKQKVKPKSKEEKSKQGKWKKTKSDSTRRDSTVRPPM